MRLPVAGPSLAVIIPCYNEATSVGAVVEAFREALPEAGIFVVDNNSTDDTARIATAARATVIREKRRGKGEALKTAFELVEADLFIVVDGDGTYPAADARKLLDPLLAGRADVAAGSRMASYTDSAPRPLHSLGNRLVCGLVNRIFGSALTDVMSGYRALTRRVVKTIPIVSMGFDFETEMTIQLLHRRYVIEEVPVAYGQRPLSSPSKLRTGADGFRVLVKIFVLLVAYKPVTFFGALSLSALAAALGTVFWASVNGHRLGSPTVSLLAGGLVLLAVAFLSLGLTISSINWRVMELETYLSKSLRSEARHQGRDVDG